MSLKKCFVVATLTPIDMNYENRKLVWIMYKHEKCREPQKCCQGILFQAFNSKKISRQSEKKKCFQGSGPLEKYFYVIFYALRAADFKVQYSVEHSGEILSVNVHPHVHTFPLSWRAQIAQISLRLL